VLLMNHASALDVPQTNFSADKRPAITVCGLFKHFGGSALYNNFSLDILKGHFISIFGPNGCDKSMLINLMVGRVRQPLICRVVP
jgi:NitT/TauT family transport system ATP-binding protein